MSEIRVPPLRGEAAGQALQRGLRLGAQQAIKRDDEWETLAPLL